VVAFGRVRDSEKEKTCSRAGGGIFNAGIQ